METSDALDEVVVSRADRARRGLGPVDGAAELLAGSGARGRAREARARCRLYLGTE